MQMIIEISEDAYNKLTQKSMLLSASAIDEAVDAVKNGMVLQKHGRLIDADELYRSMYHEAFETDTDEQEWNSGCWIRFKMFERNLDNAKIIYPAKKGEG